MRPPRFGPPPRFCKPGAIRLPPTAAEWQRLLDRLNEADRQSLPAALLDLREAYFAAPTTAQAEALVVELRHRIQQLNRQHRQREEQDAARHYAQQVIGETLEDQYRSA